MEKRWTPRVTVAAVLERDGRFLLVEERQSRGLVLNNPAGHLDIGESLPQACVREVLEETGIDALAPDCCLTDWELENVYAIYPQWLHRYAPGVSHNQERVFGLRVPSHLTVHLNPREHTAHDWHDWREAAQRCFSSSNAEAILLLPRFEPALVERRCRQQP